MSISEKIKTIDNKIKQNKAQLRVGGYGIDFWWGLQILHLRVFYFKDCNTAIQISGKKGGFSIFGG